MQVPPGLPAKRHASPAPSSRPLSQAWYTEEEVQVGAVLELHGRRFRIVGADAFTQQYRAQHG